MAPQCVIILMMLFVFELVFVLVWMLQKKQHLKERTEKSK